MAGSELSHKSKIGKIEASIADPIAGPILVQFQPGDPNNPLNFSAVKKSLITTLVTTSVFAVTLTSSAYSASSEQSRCLLACSPLPGPTRPACTGRPASFCLPHSVSAVSWSFLSCLNYLIDSYTIYAASVLAAGAMLRSFFGAAFPLFVPQMYQNLGIHWASSIPAFLALACVPFPFLMYKYGAVLRMKCKYAQEAVSLMAMAQAKTQAKTSPDDEP